MTERDWLTQRFAEHRGRLMALAYRMLGSRGDAEDAMQEAWLRVSRADGGQVENPAGWLTTVVARVCLDMLRSRGARREDAPGRRLVLPHRVSARLAGLPAGQVRACAGRGGGEAVMLRRHVRDQVAQRPARTRRHPGQVLRAGQAYHPDAGPHRLGVQADDVGSGTHGRVLGRHGRRTSCFLYALTYDT